MQKKKERKEITTTKNVTYQSFYKIKIKSKMSFKKTPLTL